ncbi:4Fe-4S binding protein [Chloroflexota bacterium]
MANRKGELTWRDLEIGVIATEPGSASRYQTGNWRSQRPAYYINKCIKCGLCQIFCPEGCIEQNEDGYFEANMYYCKGCGICAKECWPRAITIVEETE